MGQCFPLVSAGVFAALITAMFAGLWFNGQGAVFSMPGNDLTTEVVPWFHFGFGQIARGNFPLWNPHNFCGTPFFSDFTAGLLYPPHYIALILPLASALNVIVSLHFWLAGWFTSLWCRGRGVSALGSIVGGTIFMFSGAFFHHLFPGHECPIATVSWIPLILLCVDRICMDRSLTWAMVGMLGIGLQILSCFAQAIYLTGLITSLYLLLQLFESTHRRRIIFLYVLMYVGGVAIGMVQLGTGLAASRESVRQGGTNIDFASVAALPPENLSLFLAPDLLGGMDPPYFGRVFPWEVSLFCGISTLVLAGYGAVRGDPKIRRFSITLLCITTILAMGKHIWPLYWLLFHYFPLFSSFRAAARFNWFMTLYLAMLAAIGFDVIVKSPWRRTPVIITVSLAGALLLLGFVCMESGRSGVNGAWGSLLHFLAADSEHVGNPAQLGDETFIARTSAHAAIQLWYSAVTLIIFAGALWSLRYSQWVKYLLAGVTIVEVFLFAHSINVRGPMYLNYPAQWRELTEGCGPDARVLHPTLEFPDVAMLDGFNDLFGYDPLTLKRYSDLIAMTQGLDPDKCSFIPLVSRISNPTIFEMLRCRYVFWTQDFLDSEGQLRRIPRAMQLPDPMPHLQLVRQYEICDSRSAVFAAMNRPGFDPHKAVILESKPTPAPTASSSSYPPGRASIVASSTDWLEIRAHLTEPAILLVTDSYSSFWRVRPMDSSAQEKYAVMPADYTLRAIPLSAGEHHFRLEYAPLAFYVSAWVSAIAFLVWLVAFGFVQRMTIDAPKNLQSSGTLSSTG